MSLTAGELLNCQKKDLFIKKIGKKKIFLRNQLRKGRSYKYHCFFLDESKKAPGQYWFRGFFFFEPELFSLSAFVLQRKQNEAEPQV